MNLLLVQAGYPPVIIRTGDRRSYLEALEQGQTTGQTDAYYDLIYRAVGRSLDVYLNEDGGEAAPPEAAASSNLVGRAALAALTGIRPSTLKHYTELGLLPYVQEGAGLARRYDPAVIVPRLERVRALRAEGLSLGDIRAQVARRLLGSAGSQAA
jgi:hypothetical protein